MASTSSSQHELLELDDHLRDHSEPQPRLKRRCLDLASTSRSQHERLELDDLRDDSESHPRPKHTIFLSHSGAQKAFVEQLYEDLKSRGHSPFFDQSPDSLPKGEVFASHILEAAKQCVVAVVVLSPEFLQSKWCMLELSTFVEAQRTSNPNLRLFPVFYKLEVAELKDTEAMEKKWEEMAVSDERIDPGVWRNAVRVLARGNGEVFSKYDGSEVKYRKAIVDAVCRLCPPFVESRVPSMVGRDRLCNIMKGEFEKLAGDKGAKILGLYGTRGMGKTFICKALCEHFNDEYSGRVCYVEYSDGVYLELLKLILEELADIDGKTLKRIKTEEQANDLLKRFLPKKDVFLALDNVQGDLLDWSFLTYLSAKSKVVVASQTLENAQKVLGNKALYLPCPTLTAQDAVKLFLRSAGCTQPLTYWTQEEMEILNKCIDSSEKYGHHNPLVLVAMGTTIKDANVLEPTQLINKCNRIKDKKHHRKRRLSNIFKTTLDTLTADEKRLFLDVALFYPIMNLGNVEFVDMLGLLINWLEIVDDSPRREILHKIGKLKDFNQGLHRHKVHELFPNIFSVFFCEGMSWLTGPAKEEEISIQYLNKMIEIFKLKGDSMEDIPLSRREIGSIFLYRCELLGTRLNFREQLEDLQRANQFFPNHPRINQLLGDNYFGMTKYQDALNALNLAIDIYPTTDVGASYAVGSYAEAFAIRVATKLQLNDKVGFKTDLDFAAALDPHSEKVQLIRSFVKGNQVSL